MIQFNVITSQYKKKLINNNKGYKYKGTNIKLVSFLEPHTISENDLKINTNQFKLEGEYNNILNLIHKL